MQSDVGTNKRLPEYFFRNFLYFSHIQYLHYPTVSKQFWNLVQEMWPAIRNCDNNCQFQMCTKTVRPIKPLFLPFMISTAPCIPNKKGALFPASQLCSPSLREFGHLFNVAQIDVDLTDEQAVFFGFKIKLTFTDCMNMLKYLQSTRSVDVTQYARLFTQLLKLQLNEGEQLQLRNWQGYFLTQDNSLQNIRHIKCFVVSNQYAPNNSHLWLKEFPGLSREQLVQVCNLFNIETFDEKRAIIENNKEAKLDTAAAQAVAKRLPILASMVARSLGKPRDLVFRESPY